MSAQKTQNRNRTLPLLLRYETTVVPNFVLEMERYRYRRSQSDGIGLGTTRTPSISIMWSLTL